MPAKFVVTAGFCILSILTYVAFVVAFAIAQGG
jgi:hypothetical protein